MNRLHSVLLATATLVLLAGATPLRAAPTASKPCTTPDELVTASTPLPHLAAALKAKVLDVLVVGSATIFGPDASLQPGTLTSQAMGNTAPGTPPQITLAPAGPTSFPQKMADALRDAVPGLQVQVTLHGGRGLTAAEMLDMLRKDLAAHKYQLVLWQTGTVEAVRNIPAGEFYQTLMDGAVLVTEQGADLVLVDQQFSRFLHANANLDPYAQGLQQIAATPGVLLFRRFDIMRNWASEGQIDLERTPRAERRAKVEMLHTCLGQQLARLMLGASRL